ncbi:MAG: YraN family protein [Acidobacteriaceae bacterium]
MQISCLEQYRLSIFERTTGWLDRQAARKTRQPASSAHLTTGLRGEDAAYFHLRRMGYIIVARRWRSTRLRGDVDLIGWDGETLCFIEVKTRSNRSFLPAEVAVDFAKRNMLYRMAQEYVRQMDNFDQISTRFDVVSVYLLEGRPEFEVFRGAFS